jgi:hypothetical protein
LVRIIGFPKSKRLYTPTLTLNIQPGNSCPLDFIVKVDHFDRMPDAAVLPIDDHLASDPGRAELSGKRKISQLLDLQADLYWSQLKADDGREKAALAQAWERLENRLARMRMQPEPKPVDVSGGGRGGRGRKAQVVSMPVDPPPSKE